MSLSTVITNQAPYGVTHQFRLWGVPRTPNNQNLSAAHRREFSRIDMERRIHLGFLEHLRSQPKGDKARLLYQYSQQAPLSRIGGQKRSFKSPKTLHDACSRLNGLMNDLDKGELSDIGVTHVRALQRLALLIQQMGLNPPSDADLPVLQAPLSAAPLPPAPQTSQQTHQPLNANQSVAPGSASPPANDSQDETGGLQGPASTDQIDPLMEDSSSDDDDIPLRPRRETPETRRLKQEIRRLNRENRKLEKKVGQQNTVIRLMKEIVNLPEESEDEDVSMDED